MEINVLKEKQTEMFNNVRKNRHSESSDDIFFETLKTVDQFTHFENELNDISTMNKYVS